MPNDRLSEFEIELLRRMPQQVATNSVSIENLHDDIEEIKASLKDFRNEAREDSKATRRALFAFAAAVSAPIVIAAIKLAFL